MAATRIHVGGLGERVTEADLRTTFSHLGSIQSIDIIRTKGRSFAYIDFLPSSDNSLAKLFSAYNGCSWKGGKLKLEKARQHYIDRLKQEWAENAELENNEDTKDCDVDESIVASPQPKRTLDLEKMQLRLFFPKLRKVKSLPMRGTGKHKYSFQRIEVPPLPRLFCDCPEHCDPVETLKVTRAHDSYTQSDVMNDEEVNMMNSVMNRLLNKDTSPKLKSIQPSREAHDPVSEDGGMNEEEINVMNSVMKKLLGRETAKAQRKDLHESSQISVPTLALEEIVNEMDEETDDDDDIKINVGSGQNVGYDSWETILVNKMAGSSEQRTSDAANKKFDIENRKVKPLKKRKSNTGNDKDLESPVHRKRAHLETQSKDVEEHLELKGEKEFETKKSGGKWSQKSSWKELIGDARSGSFQLSNITYGGQANDVKELIPGGETSSDEEIEPSGETSSEKEIEPSGETSSDEEIEPSGETSSDEEIEHGEETSSDEEIERVETVVTNEHKPSIKKSSDRELESVRNLVRKDVDDKSLITIDTEGIQAAQPLASSAGLDNVARGSSWLQKSSWTQLVSSGNSSSFSILQILPGDVLEKQQLSKPTDYSTSNSFYSGGALSNEGRTSGKAFGGTRGSRFDFGGIDKKKEAQAIDVRGVQSNKAPKANHSSGLSMTQKSEIEKKVSNSQPGVGISETCLFMRSEDSLKEWQNAKASLSKKRNNQ